jgi:hypothetical protein
MKRNTMSHINEIKLFILSKKIIHLRINCKKKKKEKLEKKN